MPFEFGSPAMRRVAVIGAGISGMGAAYALARSNSVVLFEAEGRLGGHARTRLAGVNGETPVDTGFIVFNHANYPHLTRLFDDLSVPVVKSNMSFGASIDGGRIEYGLANFKALFAQRRNLADPRFLRMVRDVLRFNAHALTASREPGLTIGGLMGKLGMGRYFRDYYLMPLSGAIWSTPAEKIAEFPAHAMMRFFENHNLLQTTGQHQWYTVANGSRSYVSRLEAAMRRRGVEIRLGAGVQAVARHATGARVKAAGGEWEDFDEVVFATHSDDTLRLLSDPTPQETGVLGAIRYQPNRIVLHSDAAVMPRRRAVWSSWVYSENGDKHAQGIDLTYWMNSLQPWLRDEQFFVTLNGVRDIREDLIWDEVTLRHPLFDLEALAAQQTAAAINGTNHTWFCGAWMKNGFHEDGLSSGLAVARAIDASQDLGILAQ